MNVFQSCSDTSDITPLSSSHGLYLKPIARFNISVQLPSLKTPGKSLSNWEIMEKLRHYASPEEFVSLKVSKSSLEVVRFEGEIENCSKIPAVLSRLNGRSIKLSGFRESLKVRAAEAKPDFPTRHSWDQYFRDAKHMNEMKPGERPDTIHITNLPCKWFAAKHSSDKPSEYVFRKVFETFGEVTCVDIPTLDPFRSQMKSHISGIKMFSNNQNMIFEAYVQFKEYMCFVKAMDTLRGMKLVHKDEEGSAFTASVKVDFDTSKHLSESSIRRRKIEREKLMAKEREREEKEKKAREEEEQRLAKERKRMEEEKAAKLERQRKREERRKAKQLERLKQQEADEMNQKIVTEERLLLITQRRLESIRLLGELLNRLKVARENKFEDRWNKQPNQDQKNSANLKIKERELREKLLKKFKHTDDSEKEQGSRSQTNEVDQDYNNEFEPQHGNFDGNRGFRGGPRGGRRNWQNWGSRRGMNFRGPQPFLPTPYPPFPNRGFFGPRGFPRLPRFSSRGRNDGQGFMPPFIDPLYLEAALSDRYYKYFQKISRGDKKSYSRSRSRSRSRSHSRSRSYSSHSYSRSRSRSHTRSRSRSRSYSRSRHRSRSTHRQRHRSRKHSRTRSRSTSRRNSRSEHKTKRTRSNSSHHSGSREKKKVEELEGDKNKTEEKTSEKVPSEHTWSRSPSNTRSDSWENKKDEPSSSNTTQKQKKRKKSKTKKEKKKSKK